MMTTTRQQRRHAKNMQTCQYFHIFTWRCRLRRCRSFLLLLTTHNSCKQPDLSPIRLFWFHFISKSVRMIVSYFKKLLENYSIIWYLITGVSLCRLNLGLILISKQKFQEKRRLGLLHQFEKSAAVVVTFRLGIIARKIHNGSWGTNYSKLYLLKIFSCKLFSNHFTFNRYFDFFLL